MDVDVDSNGNSTNGSPVVLSTCAFDPLAKKSTLGQIWTQTTSLTPIAIRRFTLPSEGATNLEVDFPRTSNDASIEMHGTTGSSQQSWNYISNIDGTMTFINVISGRCLDILNQKIANGTQLVQYGCHYTSDTFDSQRWIHVGTLAKGQFLSAESLIKNNPMCIEARGKDDAASRVKGAVVEIDKCDNKIDQQIFTIVGQGSS